MKGRLKIGTQSIHHHRRHRRHLLRFHRFNLPLPLLAPLSRPPPSPLRLPSRPSPLLSLSLRLSRRFGRRITTSPRACRVARRSRCCSDGIIADSAAAYSVTRVRHIRRRCRRRHHRLQERRRGQHHHRRHLPLLPPRPILPSLILRRRLRPRFPSRLPFACASIATVISANIASRTCLAASARRPCLRPYHRDRHSCCCWQLRSLVRMAAW